MTSKFNDFELLGLLDSDSYTSTKSCESDQLVVIDTHSGVDNYQAVVNGAEVIEHEAGLSNEVKSIDPTKMIDTIVVPKHPVMNTNMSGEPCVGINCGAVVS